MRKNRSFISILLINTLLIGCAGEPGTVLENSATHTTTNEEAMALQEQPVTPKSTPVETAINPLTGLAVDADNLARRPVMVKVSNYPQAGRPHAGLSFADIIFDYYIGNGTNRFLAVFYGQDSDRIGPVRSGRMVDAQLVQMYSGVLGYGSADEDTDAALVTSLGKYAISHLEAPCPVFCGEDTHAATGVFANSAAISEFVREQGMENHQPDLPGMIFSENIPAGGKPANSLLVLFNYYNRGEWRYDAGSGKYLRWIEYRENETGEEFEMIPLVDRVTGEQLAFSNVVVIFAEYTELAPSRHEIDIWGNDRGLPAYIFRDGQLFEGTWRVENDSDPMQFFDEQGSPMTLKPGNTWIVIAGLSSSFEETSPASWEMFFWLP